MSCISSNFSSFFLNSLNDPSEFAKYLSNGEIKFSSFEDFQFGTGTSQTQPQQQYCTQQQQQPPQQQLNGGIGSSSSNNSSCSSNSSSTGVNSNVVVNTTGGQSSTDMFSYTQSATPTVPVSAGVSAHHQHQQQQLQQSQQQQQQQQPHPLHPHHSQHYVHGHGHPHSHPHSHTQSQPQTPNTNFHHNHLVAHHSNTPNPQNYTPQRWPTAAGPTPVVVTPHTHSTLHNNHPSGPTPNAVPHVGAQHFDGSFEFLKYLRHSNDYCESNADACSNLNSPATPTPSNHQQQQAASLIDLDSSTSHKSRSSRKVAALLSSVSRASNSLDSTLDVFDHDSKHTIFDLHHITNSSNSNESSLEMSNLAFPSSHLNASNSNTSSEGAAASSTDFSMLNSTSNAPKPLATFTIKENFDVHPSHKVEEGIFQHMNKLPPKKKENLKQLGVRFTGQMTLSDKSIVVENFIKFCQEYDIKDHRPFLSLNQSGLNKPEQIKFARYLGQGLPTFTLFCIYSNFKNLFCTKRTEIYIKDGYNLPYILDKTKRFLSNTTAGGTTPNKQNHCAPPSHPHPPLPQPKQIQTQPQNEPQPQLPMIMGPTI